jgi:hypothetical protein
MVWVDPGDLSAEDFTVQVYLGRIDENQQIVGGKVVPIAFESASTAEGLLFQGQVPCPTSGTHGVTVRLVPAHEDLPHTHCLGLIRWAS